jgi:cytochrome c
MRSLVLALGAVILAIVPGSAQDATSGEKIFVQCKACHQIGGNAKNAIGPVLNGLFGRKVGMIEGYSYSAANKNSGIT